MLFKSVVRCLFGTTFKLKRTKLSNNGELPPYAHGLGGAMHMSDQFSCCKCLFFYAAISNVVGRPIDNTY